MHESTTHTGITFAGALFLVFLVLKLVGVIAWSWWWVTAPLWVGFMVFAGIMVIALVITVFYLLIVSIWKAARKTPPRAW